MINEYQMNRIHVTIIIEHETTQKTKVIHTQINLKDHQLLLKEILGKLFDGLKGKRIRAYDFIKDGYYVLNNDLLIPVSFIDNNNILLVKVSDDAVQTSSSTVNDKQNQDVKSETSSLKKQRSKERVIFEVIEIVKKWRQIHLSKTSYKKISLQEAAKMVGLPKKSLDDYYYQLRLGQKYDFDFKAHLFDRVGVLRTYLKNLKQSSQLDKTEKHPKKLKILDNFQDISEIFYRNGGKQQDMQQQYQLKQEGINEEESEGLKNQFYNQFEFLLNEKDPFLAYDYDFKKKSMEENHSDELFF